MAVSGYLPKLERVMGLVSNIDFLHIFSIKSFLIKNSIKWTSFNIWREWPIGFKYYHKNRKVRESNPTWHSAGLFITVVPQSTLAHSQRHHLTNPMFIKNLSTIVAEPHYKVPANLRVKIFIMQWLTPALLAMRQLNNIKKKIAPTFFQAMAGQKEGMR